jgi:DNA polymerase III delta prime subunit
VPETAPVGWDEALRSLVPSFLSSNTPCFLLQAPSSTGKRTVANFLVKQAGVSAVDYRMFPQPFWTDEKGRKTDSGGLKLSEPELTMSMVRDLIEWVRVAPGPRGRVAVVRLDHTRSDGSTWRASSRVCEALLKTLEEPPAGVRFVLLASGPVLPTVESRCVVVRSGLLGVDEVAEVLYRVSDLERVEARAAAALGGGRVSPSLSARVDAVGAREAVLGFFASLAIGDVDALAGRAKGWTEIQTEMLVRAVHERVTGRYSAFSAEDLGGVPISVAMKILGLLHRFIGARPKVLMGAVAAGAMRG